MSRTALLVALGLLATLVALVGLSQALPGLLRDDLAADVPAIVIERPGRPAPPPASPGAPPPPVGYLDDDPEEPDDDEDGESDGGDDADGDTDD